MGQLSVTMWSSCPDWAECMGQLSVTMWSSCPRWAECMGQLSITGRSCPAEIFFFVYSSSHKLTIIAERWVYGSTFSYKVNFLSCWEECMGQLSVTRWTSCPAEKSVWVNFQLQCEVPILLSRVYMYGSTFTHKVKFLSHWVEHMSQLCLKVRVLVWLSWVYWSSFCYKVKFLSRWAECMGQLCHKVRFLFGWAECMGQVSVTRWSSCPTEKSGWVNFFAELLTTHFTSNLTGLSLGHCSVDIMCIRMLLLQIRIEVILLLPMVLCFCRF